jgi:SET domain-containing protein
METGAYDLSVDMICDFSRASVDHSIEAYVNGDPLLIRQHILATRINHSCRPNCEANYRNYVVTSGNKSLRLSFVFFETLRAIARGEEFTFNYGPGYVVSRSAAIRRNAAFINCVCNGGRCYFRRVMLTE